MEHVEYMEDDSSKLKEIIFNQSEDDAYNEVDLSAALLSMFFSSKLTQSAFVVVLEFTKLFSKVNVPKDFNACAKILHKEYDNSIEYTKVWYCSFCDIKVGLKYNKQRGCDICMKK